MSTNNYLYNPPRVVIYDPVNNKSRHIFIFLGNVPKIICNACINYSGSAGPQKTNYDRILKEFYGNNYKDKLGLNIKDLSEAYIKKPEIIKLIGGADPLDYDKSANYLDSTLGFAGGNEIGADYKTDDIEELLALPAKPIKKKEKKGIVEDFYVSFDMGITYITDVNIYPEDNFIELKEKIYLATNIPFYRQHLFYINKNRVDYPYVLKVEGGVYPVDIRLTHKSNNILGIGIDKYVYDSREEIKVEAYDTFKLLYSSLWTENIIYVVDLAQYTYPIQSQLMDMVNDTYQFELFYYGFVLKYWPQLTKECFYDYILNENDMQFKYPELSKNKTVLWQTYNTEKEIIDFNYKNLNKSMKFAENNTNIAIIQMLAFVNSGGVMLNIRNIFDKLRVTKCIPEIHAYIEYENKKYLLRKRHIKNASDIPFPAGSIMKNGITIAISLRKSDQDSYHAKSFVSTMQNEQSRYMFLNIWPNGRYYIKTVWNEEDELGFDEVIRIIKKFTDPIIGGINNLRRYAFIQGNSLPLINKFNINYQSLNICVFWKKVILENTFKLIRSLWEPYMRARITGPRNVQQFDKYEFLFRKGMHEYDISLIERTISASNEITLDNFYSYLSNNTIKQKWDQNYSGRVVKMSHRTTDVRFEVNDIRDREFELFYKYIVLFIYRAINDDKIKEVLSQARNYKDVKRLKKLREQDPELYNLRKHGSKTVYSKLCQGPRQPLIYTADEIKDMNSNNIKKLTKYWNFTLSKPAYYGCPNKTYPYLSFIVGIHPRSYCLPCCNKKPQNIEESKKNKIMSVCLQKHKYIEENNEGISRHIMGYGKEVDNGRLSKLPQESIKLRQIW